MTTTYSAQSSEANSSVEEALARISVRRPYFDFERISVRRPGRVRGL